MSSHSASASAPGLTLVGRSSSHFTRTVRIFAHELRTPYALQVAKDLRALAQQAYGGHPALRLPTLLAPSGQWFGSLPICRELERVAASPLRLVWPEHLPSALLSNAQELTLQAMATGVELIMNDAPESALAGKRRESLAGTLRWLDENVDRALAALPERDLSYLEVTLYCLVTHLDFRRVLDSAPFTRLHAFAAHFGARPSAQETPFRFDE